jgi:hypothetical protein
MKTRLTLLILILISQFSFSKNENKTNRWKIGNNEDIVWDVSKDQKLPHEDHLEMSGKKVSVIVTYKIDAHKNVSVNKLVVWPNMILKYDFRSYLMTKDSINPDILINGEKFVIPTVANITFNGTLAINYTKGKLEIKRCIFPSTDSSAVFDRWEIINQTAKKMKIEVKKFMQTLDFKGVDNNYSILNNIENQVAFLNKGEKITFTLEHSALIARSTKVTYDFQKEYQSRLNLISKINKNLILKTPDLVLNRLFQFTKLRAAESVFDTKLGLVHSPGGERYYGGIWANDQIEYSGPFFSYLGYDIANEASLNAYKIFMSTMTPAFNAIPSSFEMQCQLVSRGAGDRGDASMYAWGASLYALTRGDKEIARQLWPAIIWCLEYTEHKITKDGVVASNTDEMEGRISTGNANLSTSCLAYGAFSNAAIVAKALNEPTCVIDKYLKIAADLRINIEKHFGADIEGYHTYRYFEGHNTFRHWICLPLVMGINERQQGTIKALLEKLWTPNGLLVEKGMNNFWDRATIYALRGIFKGGETELALNKLTAYSNQRLLGEHVPYPVEAYPEGNQAHLSAESALYCRTFTEGLFGIQPTGFNRFTCIPRLPNGWNEMSLLNVCAFNTKFSILVKSIDQLSIRVIVLKDNKEIYSKTDKKGSSFDIEL